MIDVSSILDDWRRKVEYPWINIAVPRESLKLIIDEIEELEKENAALAAAICPTFYGDEYGNARCRDIDELRKERDVYKAAADGIRDLIDGIKEQL